MTGKNSRSEYDELEEKIKYYLELLADENKLKAVLRGEMIEIRDKFGDKRKTEIQEIEDEIDIEDLIEEETCAFTLSNQGYIKRMPVDTYRTQSRGGRGVNAQNLKEEDYVKSLTIASTHDHMLFFTDQGRVHHRKGYQIPEAGRTARGTAIVNVLPLNPGESVTAMVITREFDENEFLMMVTRKGTVKRIPFVSLKTNRKAGIRAITLDEDDHLINVIRTNGDDDIVLATAFGYAICFNENDVRCMGRDAAGVRGIMLTDGDYVVGAEKAEEGKTLLTVTQNGYGKRTALTEYLRTGPNGEKQAQSRGGKGLKNYNITPKTGNVAGCRVVSESDDVMLIENGGVIIRIPASSINVYKRDVQGVIVMRIDDGNQVVSLERVEKMDEEEIRRTGMKTVTLYTDGACSGNPGPGGWGAILEYNGVEKELSGGEDSTTNNRMELTAVIRGLQALKEPCTVELYSDSKYVIDALEKGLGVGLEKARLGKIRQKARPEFRPLGNLTDPDAEARRALPLGQGTRGEPEEQPLRRAGSQRVEKA